MRDPARIDRILEAVRRVWVESPDLRLGQLIVNAIRPSRPCPQVFYPEDDRLERGLADYWTGPIPPPPPTDIALPLDRERAAVLLALIERFVKTGRGTADNRAEAMVLADLLDALRGQLPEAVQSDWNRRLNDARKAVEEGVA